MIRRTALTLGLGLLAACNPGERRDPRTEDHRGSAPADPSPSEIRLALEAEITTLDPATAADAVSRRITGQIFETLVDWDPGGRGLVPELLVAAPIVDDAGTTVTMRLRRGVDAHYFTADPCLRGQGPTRGRPVEVMDAAASILRHAEPGLAGAWGLLAGRIVGLDAWRDLDPTTRPPLPEGMIVDAANQTLTLRLTRPQPELPAILASPQLAIVPGECAAYYDGGAPERPPFARHPVGSGPYRLDHAASDLPRAAVLVRSEFGGRRPLPPLTGDLPGCDRQASIERVILEHFAGPELALRLFRDGTLAALAPGQSTFAAVIRDGAVIPGAVPDDARLLRFPVLATTLLVFRMDDPVIGQSKDPAEDRRHRALRQAIAEAFDGGRYRAILRNDAWSRPATQVTPRGIFDPGAGVELHAHAPATARREVAMKLAEETGLFGDGRRLALRYATTTGPAAQQEAAILREALRPLGVDLEITHDDAYLSKLAGAQLFALRFDADYPDAEDFLAPFVCGAPGSYSGYCSPEFDRRFAALATLPDGPARAAEIAALERILGDDLPVRPIDEPELWLLVRARVANVHRDPLTGLRIELFCPQP